MRPVNLIPPEERRGHDAPLRSGPLVYILVGALVAVLAAVTAMALLDSQISDRKGELKRLEREDAVVAARALRLSAYTQFRALHEQRVETVASLADSRFDWERVMRELSLILPKDVWLTDLTASATGGAGGDAGGSSSGLGSSIAGPSLQLSGCAAGQEGVAGFVTALKDIDGVTRVGVQSSALADGEAGPEEAASGGGEGGCSSQDFIASFEIVVAFDAAPVPLAASGESAPISATEQSEAAAAEESGEGSEGG